MNTVYRWSMTVINALKLLAPCNNDKMHKISAKFYFKDSLLRWVISKHKYRNSMLKFITALEWSFLFSVSMLFIEPWHHLMSWTIARILKNSNKDWQQNRPFLVDVNLFSIPSMSKLIKKKSRLAAESLAEQPMRTLRLFFHANREHHNILTAKFIKVQRCPTLLNGHKNKVRHIRIFVVEKISP